MGVFWITGLSSAGKSTISALIYDRIKNKRPDVVELDGDVMRDVFGGDCGYSKNDRLKSAYRNARLCKLLNDQGLIVICSTISMFDVVRDWNRNHIDDYFEIYLKVSSDDLLFRDKKNVYNSPSDAVVSFDNGWEEPKNPHLIINNGEGDDININVDVVLSSCPFEI
jgi:adenylylsulfate kinase-like enzyme